jgi:hypothetical protein
MNRCSFASALLPLFLFRAVSAAGEPSDLPLVFQDNFARGIDRWEPTDPLAWRMVRTDKGSVYNQFKNSSYKPPHRSPLNISLIKQLTVTDFVFQAKLQSTGQDGPHRDMCLFFGYQDPAHFYYVHIAKAADDHANQIFIVNGADRKKISKTSTKGTPWDDKWHAVKIVRRIEPGLVEVFFDDMKQPIMTAQDKTFAWGRVGVGSFDDSGNWTDVRVWGKKK